MVYVNSIANVLNALEMMGFFAYALPFLIVFALVFGILNKSNVLGSNKGIQVVLAFAVGLLSLQFEYVTVFFATIIPYTGIALVILLVALILMGLFADDADTKWIKYIWLGIGIISFIAIIWVSFEEFSWNFGGGFWNWITLNEVVPILLVLIVIGVAIGWIVSEGKGKKKTETL